MQLSQVVELLFPQTGLKKYETGCIMAEHDALPSVYQVQMCMPASDWIDIGKRCLRYFRQLDGKSFGTVKYDALANSTTRPAELICKFGSKNLRQQKQCPEKSHTQGETAL